MMGKVEKLIRKAEKYVKSGYPIPVALQRELLDVGISPSLLEGRHKQLNLWNSEQLEEVEGY